MKKNSGPSEASPVLNDRRGRAIPVAVLLIFVVLLSMGSGFYASASHFAAQASDVTVTTTLFTTTTSWTTSTIWSTVTSTVLGVWTTVQYTTSTSTVTVTGTPRTAKIITANGNAHISTAQSMFGGASGLFNGNGAYLSTPNSPDWTFGSGDFTIDLWVRFNSLPVNGAYEALLAQVQSASPINLWGLYVYNNAGTYQWRFRVWSANSLVIATQKNAAVALQANTWYHVAVVRSGNSWYIFQNGIQCGTTDSYSASVPGFAASVTIGTDLTGTGASWLNGYIDELRISKGVARWTTNFTPPTTAYTGDSNTVLLLHMDGADGSTTFIDSP